MKSIENISTLYADLVIETGVGLYKGQSLLIKTGPAHYWFAQKLAESAYAKGALHVKIDTDDYRLLKARLAAQSDEEITNVPDYSTAIDYEMMAKDWAYVRIDNTADRFYLSDCDADKLSSYRGALSKAGHVYMQSRMRHEHPWCVICVPDEVWATDVLGKTASVAQLWDLLVPILKLDQKDPSQAWKDHSNALATRGTTLDTMQIKNLHFTSAKTDFTVGFTPQSRWMGGGDPLPNGSWFLANIPTEEIFTTPDRLSASGYVETTRPVSVMGSQCEGIRLEFDEGKVISCTAQKGQEVMDRFLTIDEGARYLGEVALVDETSPIAQSKQIFHSILYDENASCHLALGAGYPSCLAHAQQLNTPEKLLQARCNQSLVHTDFMIGSLDMRIEATTYEDKKVIIMDKGRFTL
ncbi:MAG: aminopeptidase [Sphaerochaetaceae bacterium]